MPTYEDLERTLKQALALERAPVAVTFCAAEPRHIRKFSGQVPSGCTFWKLAAEAEPFYTVPADHYNCPVGSYTHRIALPEEREAELNGVLGFMTDIGYVRSEEVPRIPRWPESPAAVVYARLGASPLPPDVVIVAARAASAMLLAEASAAAGKGGGAALPRPTCMAIAAAHANGTTLSLACIGNRVYTDLGDDQFYAMVRGSDLADVAGALQRVVSANEQLATYHRGRKLQLLQT